MGLTGTGKDFNIDIQYCLFPHRFCLQWKHNEMSKIVAQLKSKSGKSLCTGTGQFQTVQLDKRQGSECSTPKQTEMTSHSFTSSGDKIHICSECQKSFGQSGGLKRHMVTHTKERAYNCIQCQRSFGQAAVLKRHMLTHSGSKTHTC